MLLLLIIFQGFLFLICLLIFQVFHIVKPFEENEHKHNLFYLSFMKIAKFDQCLKSSKYQGKVNLRILVQTIERVDLQK